MNTIVLLALIAMATVIVLGRPSEDLVLDLEDDIEDDALEQTTFNRTSFRDIVREPKGLKPLIRPRFRPNQELPKELCVTVRAFFNRPFAEKVVKDKWLTRSKLHFTREVIDEIFKEANRLFQKPGLDTKITLQRVGSIDFVDDHESNYWHTEPIAKNEFWLDEPSLQELLDDSVDHNAFFTYDGNDDSSGVATMGTVCDDEPWDRSSLNEYGGSIKSTAYILAHEIGHALGMDHDFNTTEWSNSRHTRKTERGEVCTHVGGVMDYGNRLPRRWSKCSNNDLKEYWGSEGHENCLSSKKCRIYK